MNSSNGNVNQIGPEIINPAGGVVQDSLSTGKGSMTLIGNYHTWISFGDYNLTSTGTWKHSSLYHLFKAKMTI